MTSAYRQEDAGKLERIVGYIKDDNWIASYMGVPVQVVRDARMRLPKGTFVASRRDAEPIGMATGEGAAIRLGSHNLLRAMLRYGAGQPAQRRGLPGLSAHQFHSLCNQHGVAIL